MYQDTITLFNRKPGSDGDTWYPTVLRNVNLNIDRAAILAKYGAESQDRVAMNIRYSKRFGKIHIGNKVWTLPKEWTGENNTLTLSSDGDFFWVGEWQGGVVSDSEYRGGFYSWMNRAYDNVYAITSVGIYSVIPHFEVMGK